VLLFVYGTLRRGEPNHLELGEARFLRSVWTEPRYELVDLGDYPALLEDGDAPVAGELYEVDAALLGWLDRFEDVPELYERKSVATPDGAVLAYVMSRARAGHAPRIANGDWQAYRAGDTGPTGG
jgi:gamma-glutamylaminecyclotransferase